MTRIFFSGKISVNSSIAIDDTQNIHYISCVLKKKCDESITIFNSEDGEFECKIAFISRKKILLNTKKRITPPLEDSSLHKINCVIGIIKQTRLLNCIDMLTQFGIKNFSLVKCLYSQNYNINIEKLHTRIVSSIQQSNRSIIPKIKLFPSLQDFLNETKKDEIFILADPTHKTDLLSKKTFFNAYEKNKNLVLFIGPEGGFSQEEIVQIKQFNNSSFFSVKLNDGVLRSETASIVLAAKIHEYIKSTE